MNTQTVHIQHTTLVKGKGYIWRKRHDGGMLTIHLQTYDVNDAQKRAAQMTLRYIQLSQFDVPLSSMKDTLTKYRDSLIHESKIIPIYTRSHLARLEVMNVHQVCTFCVPIYERSELSAIYE